MPKVVLTFEPPGSLTAGSPGGRGRWERWYIFLGRIDRSDEENVLVVGTAVPGTPSENRSPVAEGCGRKQPAVRLAVLVGLGPSASGMHPGWGWRALTTGKSKLF